MIADIAPTLLSILSTGLEILLALLAGLLLIVVSFVLLPVVIQFDARRHREPEAPVDLAAFVAPWLGGLGISLCKIACGWEATILLFGRIRLYQWQITTSESPDPHPSPDVSAGPPSSETAESTPATTIGMQLTPSEPALSHTEVASGRGATSAHEDGHLTTPTPTTSDADGLSDTKASTSGGEESGADDDSRSGIFRRMEQGWRDIRPFLPHTGRLLRRLVRIVGLRRFHVVATIGLDDAAATGKLLGHIQATRPLLPRWARMDIDADFIRPASYGRASVRLHLYLARLLAALGRFAVRAGYLWLRRWWRLRQTARTLSVVTH